LKSLNADSRTPDDAPKQIALGLVSHHLTSKSDKIYGVQYKVNLSDVAWTTLVGTVPGTGGNAKYVVIGGAQAAPRFYRVFEQP